MTSKEAKIRSVYQSIDKKATGRLSDFKKSLVHISVYEAEKKDNPGNSRYVFLGMYAFKGLLAETIGQYVSGNGKQLQHYLGNVFSNEKLAKIFDDLKLSEIVQVHKSLNANDLKHVFASAYLGFLFLNATEAFIKKTIVKYFLEESAHLLPKSKALNIFAILKAKAETVLSSKVKLVYDTTKSEGGVLNKTSVILASGECIGQHESASETYAKKKAIKLALKHILAIEASQPENVESEANRKVAEEQKKQREKAEKQKKHQQRAEQKQKERAIIKAEVEKQAKLREQQRTLNKANAKKSKLKKKAEVV